MKIRFEKRLERSRTAAFAVPILSLLLALVLGGILLALAGANPIETYQAMLVGAFGSRYAISETLVKAIPLMLTALGVSIAFRMLFWNIGAEGQLAMGGVRRDGYGPVHRAARSRGAGAAPGHRGGVRGRRAVGVVARRPQGVGGRQRDHHDPDDELHRHPVDRVPVLRPLEGPPGLRLPRHRGVPGGRVAAALRQHARPPGPHHRRPRRLFHLARADADQVGLRNSRRSGRIPPRRSTRASTQRATSSW